MNISTRLLFNKLKIIRVKHLLEVSKSEGKIGLLQNLLFLLMINIIIQSLMLNGIIPNSKEDVKIFRTIFILSMVLIYVAYYSPILFDYKKQ